MSLVNCHFVSTQSVWWPCHFKCHHGNSKRPNSTSSVFTNNELFLWALSWGHNSTEKCWIFREIYYTLKIVALYYTLSCICRLSISLGFVNGRMLCILWGWSALLSHFCPHGPISIQSLPAKVFILVDAYSPQPVRRPNSLFSTKEC